MVDLAEEPRPPVAFSQLPLSPETLNALNSIGYQYATPVQAGSIQPALAGRDLMVQSQTGTGKTAAFSLPLIETLKDLHCIGALVLAPTRELARQVMQEAQRLSSHVTNFSVSCIYGGVSFDDQVTALKQKPNIVVGTPGRVLDHLRRKTLVLKELKCFVLDEADEMLSMGFAEELEEILRFVPKQRQTLFFSATFPANVKRYAKKTLQDPISLSFLSESSSADELEHYYMMLPGVARHTHLRNLILELNPERAIIFTNTRKDADRTAQMLNKYGLESHKLSGDMDQGLRDRVMKKMKNKQIRFLVATDVAARGIDISQLTHVFHYQLPENPEVYIHRSGRTGRAGAKGFVYSLASSKDLSVIYALKRFHHLNLQERGLPIAPKVSSKKESNSSLTSTKLKEHTRKQAQSEKVTQGKQRIARTPKADASKLRPSQQTSNSISHRPESKHESQTVPKSQAVPMSQVTLKAISKDESFQDKVYTKTPRQRRKPNRRSRSFSVDQVLDRLMSSANLDIDSFVQLSETELSKLAQNIIDSETAPKLTFTILNILQSNLKLSLNRTKDSQTKPEKTHCRQAKKVPLKEAGSESQKLHINLGWRDLTGGHSAVKELIAELGGLLPEDIKQLNVKASRSTFLVDRIFQDDLIAAINGEEVFNKTLSVKLRT